MIIERFDNGVLVETVEVPDVPEPAPVGLDAFVAQLDERLADPAVNSIAEIKTEIRSALSLLA